MYALPRGYESIIASRQCKDCGNRLNSSSKDGRCKRCAFLLEQQRQAIQEAYALMRNVGPPAPVKTPTASASPQLASMQNRWRVSSTHLTNPGVVPSFESSAHSGVALGKRKTVDEGSGARKSRTKPRSTATIQMFQTEAQAYQSIASAMEMCKNAPVVGSSTTPHSPRCVRFHGAYSIVADPTVSQQTRVEMVSVKLKEISKLPHR